MTRGLLKLWGLGFLGSIVLWQLFGRLSEAAGYENVLESELEQWSVTEQFLLVVLAPLFEELIYRLPLKLAFDLLSLRFLWWRRDLFRRSKRHGVLVDSPLGRCLSGVPFNSDLRSS